MRPHLSPTPVEPYFLPYDTTWRDTVWFHGTKSGLLEAISENGILPRKNLNSNGNRSLHPSCPEMVYLTTAYAMHYAKAADAPGLTAILELDLAKLDKAKFFGDEDAYALSTVEDMPELNQMSLAHRVSFWRENLANTDALTSQRILGNATYKGAVPPDAIRRVRLLTDREAALMTLQISDPVISPQNFKLLGGAAQRFCKWLVGRPTDLDEWFERAGAPAIPPMSLTDACLYHRQEFPPTLR